MKTQLQQAAAVMLVALYYGWTGMGLVLNSAVAG